MNTKSCRAYSFRLPTLGWNAVQHLEKMLKDLGKKLPFLLHPADNDTAPVKLPLFAEQAPPTSPVQAGPIAGLSSVEWPSTSLAWAPPPAPAPGGSEGPGREGCYKGLVG